MSISQEGAVQISVRPAIIFLLFALVSACSGKPSELPVSPSAPATASPTLAPQSTSTPTNYFDYVKVRPTFQMLTRTARALTPSVTPRPTVTLAPPTFTPTLPPPDPAYPLGSQGPWLFIEQSAYNKSQDVYEKRISVMSRDGTDWTAFDLPQINYAERYWIFDPAPRGGYIAFRTADIKGYPMFIQPNGLDDQLFIVKLPENRLMRKIPLLGTSAWEKAEKDFQKPENSSPVLGILQDESSFQWSPDGRYLAFSTALNGTKTDLYLYDTHSDEIKRLTDTQSNSIAWGWSPDGQTLIFKNVIEYGIDFGLMYSTFSGAYALPLGGEPTLLYQPEGGEVLEWVSNESILVYNYGLEGYKWDLREVNLQKNEVKLLHEGYFTSLSKDSFPRTILINLSDDFVYHDYEDPSGIYRLDIDSHEKTMFLPCVNCSAHWNQKLRLIELWLYGDGSDAIPGIKFYNSTGKEVGFIEGPDFREFYTSPDGAWLIRAGDNNIKLYNRKLEIVQEFSGYFPLWESDSSGFFKVQPDCEGIPGECIVFHLRNDGWKQSIIKNNRSGISSLFMISP